MQPGRLVVLTGPSGVGKGSIMAHLRATRTLPAWFSISATTRPPRPGEVDGEHYFFVDEQRFLQMIERGELLEHAHFAGKRYGTPREPVEDHLRRGESVLLEIELAGARQVKIAMPEAFMVFLAPPSREELRRRLIGRGTETDEQVAARLAQADVEMAAEGEFDAVVVNDDIERASAELVDLIVGRRPARAGRVTHERT